MKLPVSLFLPALVLTVVFPVLLLADVTSGADFLKIPRSARAIALGESYTAALDDPNALDYNPAALNTIRSIGVSMLYHTWIDNSYGLYFCGAGRISDLVLGGSVYWFNYGGLKEYDYYGNLINQYNPSDLNVKAAVSVDAGLFLDALQGMSLGACGSFVNRYLLDESLYGFTMDVGVNYKTTLGKILNIKDNYFNLKYGNLPINVGFAVQNIGFAAETMTPVKFSAGVSFGIFPEFNLSMDLSKDVYNTPWVFKMGAEYTIFDILSLRAGLNFGKESGIISMGVGLRYPFLFNNLRFDYAFKPLGVLGNSHYLSLYMDLKFDIRPVDYYMKGVYFFSRKDYLNTKNMWKQALVMEPKNELYKERLAMIEEIVKVEELEPDKKKSEAKSDTLERKIVQDLYGDRPGAVVSGSQVTFYYRSVNRLIQSVAITGDFNSWDTNGVQMVRMEDGWTISIDMKPGRRQYKYIVDGTRFIVDPANPDSAPDGMGGKNSVVFVPEIQMTNQQMNTNVAPVKSDTNEEIMYRKLMEETTPEKTAPVSTNAPLPEQKVIYTNINIRSTN